MDNGRLVAVGVMISEKQRKEIRVLLAEDYPTNREVAIWHLSKAGYQIDVTTNGQEAVDAFREKHYHLILMDIEMPVMDGYEATREIRRLEASRNRTKEAKLSGAPKRVPIVAMTGHAVKGERQRYFDAGMDDCVTKPLKGKSLLAVAEKWVSRGVKARKEIPPDFPGERDRLAKIVADFSNDVRVQIGVMRRALRDGEADVVRSEAHTIKGGAVMLDFYELSRIASELEEIGKSGNLEKGIQVLENLEKEFKSLEMGLK